MDTVAFIGDELTACGFRLAGARTYVVPVEQAGAALAEARAAASLVLLGASHAGGVPGAELDAALSGLEPLTIIVDDLLEQHPAPDLEATLRRALGLDFA